MMDKFSNGFINGKAEEDYIKIDVFAKIKKMKRECFKVDNSQFFRI